MNIFTKFATGGLLLMTFAQTFAAETGDLAQCNEMGRVEGKGEGGSPITCAIKHMFQSRIRRYKETEPVEMTVGSPPMQSDDTGTPGPGNWEINVAISGELAGAEHRIEAPLLDINYGIGEDVQLKFELPYVLQAQMADTGADDGDVERAHGVGDAILGLKYRFYDNKTNGLSLALYPQIKFRTPGANRRVSAEKTTWIVPAILTREFEKFSITANAGVEFADERRYFASIGAGLRATDRVALLAEIAGRNLNAHDEKILLLNVGLRSKLSESQSVSASIGHDIYAGGEQKRQAYFTLAFQQLFGK